MEAKLTLLNQTIANMGRIAVALSGGVDSTTLAHQAVASVGAANVIAVTVRSPLQAADEISSAARIAERLGIRHIVMDLDELDVPEVAYNDPRRCYYCKHRRFTVLRETVEALGDDYVLVHGENADDANDYRPGAKAARELGVRAPFAEVGLTKAEIRELARKHGLETWDRPAAPCLATRFPVGTRLTSEKLRRVEEAEQLVREIVGVKDCRVRDEGDTARIELAPEAMANTVQRATRGPLVEALRDLGYLRITLDLAGYKMGSMNDTESGQDDIR